VSSYSKEFVDSELALDDSPVPTVSPSARQYIPPGTGPPATCVPPTLPIPGCRLLSVRECRNMTETKFRREYCFAFEAVEGLVYPDFAKKAHIGRKRDERIARGYGRKVGGIDFGFRNPFAATWGVSRPQRHSLVNWRALLPAKAAQLPCPALAQGSNVVCGSGRSRRHCRASRCRFQGHQVQEQPAARNRRRQRQVGKRRATHLRRLLSESAQGSRALPL